MKILHVINSLAAGGAEKLVSELTTVLSDECEVSLFTFESSQDIFQKNVGNKVNFYSFKEVGFFSFKKIRILAKLIKKHDIIHTHLFPAFYIVAFLSVFYREKKFVYTEHNTYNKRRKWFFWLLEKWVYSKYNVIVCISEGVKKSLQSWVGKAVSTQTITNFIDLKKITKSNKCKIETTDISNKIVLVMVGSFTEQKDQTTLVKMFCELPKKYILFLVGDGPKRQLLEKLVKNLGLHNRIFFFGIQKEVIPILKNCKYGILSSHWEGFGIVALEYMASGLITLGSDVSGLNEIIPCKENLFKVGNHSQLANRILEIETNSDLEDRILLKQNNLLQKHDITTSVKEHMQLYSN